MKNVLYFLTAAIMTFTSCSGTNDDLKNIKIEMTSQDVVEAIGEPSEKFKLANDSTGALEVWHYKTDEVTTHTISFKNDHVVQITEDFEENQKNLKALISE